MFFDRFKWWLRFLLMLLTVVIGGPIVVAAAAGSEALGGVASVYRLIWVVPVLSIVAAALIAWLDKDDVDQV